MRFPNWRPIAAVIALAGGATVAAAQSQRAAEPDVLRELLTEVRGLRAAMEDMAVAGARVQLSLGRLQLQEQRVNTMIRRLESVRDALGKAEREVTAQQGQLEGMQKMFKELQPTSDNPLTQMMEGFKTAIAAGALEVQRLQSEEAELQQQITGEQGRWAEINRATEDLERALANRRPR